MWEDLGAGKKIKFDYWQFNNLRRAKLIALKGAVGVTVYNYSIHFPCPKQGGKNRCILIILAECSFETEILDIAKNTKYKVQFRRPFPIMSGYTKYVGGEMYNSKPRNTRIDCYLFDMVYYNNSNNNIMYIWSMDP